MVKFGLFLMRKRDFPGVPRSENHNQGFVSLVDPWPKCISFVISLNNPLFFCLALKVMIALDCLFLFGLKSYDRP